MFWSIKYPSLKLFKTIEYLKYFADRTETD